MNTQVLDALKHVTYVYKHQVFFYAKALLLGEKESRKMTWQIVRCA